MRDHDFTRLYNEHASALYGFLSYRTGDRVLAEDLLADTFERVLRARRDYDRARGSERTWLYTIALNCVRDTARRAAVETRVLAQVGGGEATGWTDAGVDVLHDRGDLRAALTTLTEVEREVVALRFGADLTLAEIASAIGEPRSTVEDRLYRSLRKLRERLDAAG